MAVRPDRRFADLRPFLEHLRELGFRPRSVVDVGAHAGEWTSLALESFPDSRYFLVEPQEELRGRLEALCALHPKVEWVQAAAGARDELRVFTIWPDLQGSSFLPLRDPSKVTDGTQREIRIRRLDDLLDARSIDDADLVKLDVQGFELEVLRGAPRLLARAELLILETSLFRFLPGIPILRDVIEFMADHGFEVYDVPGYIWRPIDGALGQIDVAFARRTGQLRSHDLW